MCRALASSVIAVAFLVSACEDPPPRGSPLVVMTQDLGIGADLEAVLAASDAELGALVDAMWDDRERASFAARADAIATGIGLYQPDLVGVQSAVQWRQQVPASPSPAGEVVADHLELLLDALAARGLAYDPVAVTTTSDLELTGASGNDYRVVDREVILARRDVATSGASGGVYAARRTVALGGTLTERRRGWAIVVAQTADRHYRFVSTRLDAVDPDVQRSQVQELAQIVPADVPTLLVGDVAADPHRDTSPGFGHFLHFSSRFADAAASAGASFPSCCRDPRLANPAARLDRRTDLVLGTLHFRPSWAATLLGNSTGMVDGLWPSAHAGIVAGVWLVE